jgi:hypothetical protein
MIEKVGKIEDPHKIGYYSGLMEGLAFFSQFLTGFLVLYSYKFLLTQTLPGIHSPDLDHSSRISDKI